MNQHTQSCVDTLAQYSDAEIAGELLRRAEARAHEVAVAQAIEILREVPGILSPKWTINKLCDLAVTHDLSATAMFSAWERLSSEARISNPTCETGGVNNA